MAKPKPISIEVVEERGDRMIVFAYTNGEAVRKNVEKIKPTRKTMRASKGRSFRKKQF